MYHLDNFYFHYLKVGTLWKNPKPPEICQIYPVLWPRWSGIFITACAKLTTYYLHPPLLSKIIWSKELIDFCTMSFWSKVIYKRHGMQCMEPYNVLIQGWNNFTPCSCIWVMFPLAIITWPNVCMIYDWAFPQQITQ